MAVFRSIVIKWQGVDYDCIPSMSLVRRCEQQGFKLTRVLQSISSGHPEIGMLSLLVASMLRDAGCQGVTDDDVGAVLLNAEPETILGLVTPVMNAFVWEPDEKKLEAPSVK